MQYRLFWSRRKILNHYLRFGKLFLSVKRPALMGMWPYPARMRLSVRNMKKIQIGWDIFSEIIEEFQKNWNSFSEKFEKNFQKISERVYLIFWNVKPWAQQSRLEVSTVGEAERALLSPACSSASGGGWDAEGFCTELVCVNTDSAFPHEGKLQLPPPTFPTTRKTPFLLSPHCPTLPLLELPW